MNIGAPELMLIIALAILMIGPQRMVEIMRTLGRVATKLRQISGEFTGIVRSELGDVERETRGAMEEITGKAGKPAEVANALKASKGEAEKSVQGLLKDGLGLSDVASELKAAASDARRFVKKVSEDEEKAPIQEPEQPPKPPATP